MRRRLFLAAFVLLAATAAADEKEPPFPEGVSRQIWGGLRFTIEMPVDFDAEKEYSLLVGLHGAGATDQDFATWFEPLVPYDFIVCCPKSAGPAWNPKDLDRVEALVGHLREVLPIGAGRMHGIGFSNGGANLGRIVFDPDLPFATGCWMGSGFAGGKVPKRARTEFAAIALVGEKDYAFGAAKATVKTLGKKVRRVDFESQPELEHRIPDELMPFYYYWVKVMEGRFLPGEDESLDWHRAPKRALEKMREEKVPGFFYFFDERDAAKDDERLARARHAQNVVLLDPLVRHYAKQVVAVIADVEVAGDAALMKEFGLTTTPAFAVLDEKGEVVARLEGKIETEALAKALRGIAPDRKPPK